MQPNQKLIMTVRCPSAPGQVGAIARFLDHHSYYVEEISVFDSHDKTAFFVRCLFHAVTSDTMDLEKLRSEFSVVAEGFKMEFSIYDPLIKPRTMILVSRLDHCLNDLLYRWRAGELQTEITAVVSNHKDLEHIATRHGLPFHHLPINVQTKEEQEARLIGLIEDTQTEIVVLARYMQILSQRLCKLLEGRTINIHHSFLPGFKGAKPYQQAYDRGVKIIGATAHYVTTDLDEGPIIEQSVTQVDHTLDVLQLQAIGRDMECLALSRALKLHLDRRVFVDGLKTVILR